MIIFRKILIAFRGVFCKEEVKYGYKSPSARLSNNAKVYCPINLYMYENTNIDGSATIMNVHANFIMKKDSGAAVGLTVITGNHMSIVGRSIKQIPTKTKMKEDVHHEYDKDVIVEEDVWIASNVTLLCGVSIGRGCEVGACSVVRKSTPPYSIVVGNPAKVVGFRFTPEEIIEHEKALYPEEERLPLDLLENNYNKYFISRIKEIKEFTRLSL